MPEEYIRDDVRVRRLKYYFRLVDKIFDLWTLFWNTKSMTEYKNTETGGNRM